VLDNGNCDSIPRVGKSFSLLTGSGTHPALYTMGIGGSFFGSKEAGGGGGGEVEDKSDNVA